VEPKVDNEVNACIYCRRIAADLEAGEGLTDEHIIAAGLLGPLILPNASRKRCAEATGRCERKIMREMFPEVRAQYGIASRFEEVSLGFVRRTRERPDVWRREGNPWRKSLY
jgi:hypothetical protein